ncbi:hypothetical protein FHS94_000998 [Sphingomonas aerophila]|uniref:Tail specific protease domain-containing protein n=2 Tax=Sphingomonas aerophila TaxID=1344948 RepID=A0A7W9BBI5_9SPHN|nr:hypothetical protein [Sphingomonas aerophila]
MRDQYVFPERGELVASKITAALAEGKYNDVKTPAELASQLSAAASAVTHDKHLNVVSMGAPPPEGKPREMPSAEAGVTRADKLAGGVGYIEVVGFPELSFSKRVLDTAMSALSGSRSLIIDVRRNGGGDPEAVAYLVSFLIPPDRPINDIVSRTAKTTNLTRQSFRSVRTPVSFLKVPVYVLTSGDTFSGGEEFAYDVQALKRATLIGETTGGGANPVGPVDIGHGITALIPFGRAENPITKKNWEGVGVRPDVPVPANLALGAALTRAGLKPVAEIASASTERVFGPRTNPLPGSEAALRNLLAAIASGRTIQGIVVPQFASAVEAVLPRFRAELASLGALQSANFNKPDALGGDEYKLTFANGRRKMALVVRDDGKIVIASSLAPLSPGD